MFAGIAKGILLAALRAKWPGARIEFEIRINGTTYITDRWDVVVADLQAQQLTIEVDANGAAIKAETKKLPIRQ